MQIAVKVLLEACIKLECNIAVRCRALVLYHQTMRFMEMTPELKYDETMVAAAALKCAAIYEKHNLDFDSIALVFYSIVNRTLKVLHPRSQEYIAIKKSLITVYHIVQRKLQFIFCHRLSHEFLLPFLDFIFERNFKLAPFHQQVALACIAFANDAYTDAMCLNYKPDHIAIACIHAALHVFGLLKEMNLLEPWFEGFSRDLTIEKLREIKVFLFQLYHGEGKDQDEGCEIIDEKLCEEPNEQIDKMVLRMRQKKLETVVERKCVNKVEEESKQKPKGRGEMKYGPGRKKMLDGNSEKERSKKKFENIKKYERIVKMGLIHGTSSQVNSNLNQLLSSWTERIRAARKLN